MTTDIDAMIRAASTMREAINTVGERFSLPSGWLNTDFENTSSYTPKLVQYSEYYRTFSNIVTIRTVSAEYLIAMKLRSGRLYKNDLSDILGILSEHEKRKDPITMDQIQAAFSDLYGDWNLLSEKSRIFIKNVMKNGSFEEQYRKTLQGEQETNRLLTNFEENYPETVNSANVDEILAMLRGKKN